MRRERQTTDHETDLRSALHQLGKSIKSYRCAANLTQEELGHRIDKDQAYISRIEKGDINPTFATLLAVSNELEVSLSKLLDRPSSSHETSL